jgi:hypothetical protein
MLFRVFNIKWRENIGTYTPDALYIRVYDSNYDDAETTAMRYMAKLVPNAMEWSSDKDWWDNQENEENSFAFLIGASREVLSQCVEEMQNLLMEISTDRIGPVTSKMTKFQIESAAKLVKKLEETTAYSYWNKRTPSNVKA